MGHLVGAQLRETGAALHGDGRIAGEMRKPDSALVHANKKLIVVLLHHHLARVCGTAACV